MPDLSNASVVLAFTTVVSLLLLLFLIFMATASSAKEAIIPVAIFGGASAIGLGLSTPGRG
jgi:hypothetical protein